MYIKQCTCTGMYRYHSRLFSPTSSVVVRHGVHIIVMKYHRCTSIMPPTRCSSGQRYRYKREPRIAIYLMINKPLSSVLISHGDCGSFLKGLSRARL